MGIRQNPNRGHFRPKICRPVLSKFKIIVKSGSLMYGVPPCGISYLYALKMSIVHFTLQLITVDFTVDFYEMDIFRSNFFLSNLVSHNF